LTVGLSLSVGGFHVHYFWEGGEKLATKLKKRKGVTTAREMEFEWRENFRRETLSRISQSASGINSLTSRGGDLVGQGKHRREQAVRPRRS